ncbi:hypothetical protein [Schaalia suimastitidis]|uniref:hypothetical protein n=1 Tax=Schaalia suimastitidis TaxID=121163 RepID=UPI0004177DC6|nr:hypothetical protein [Schaalia suimastitidis]
MFTRRLMAVAAVGVLGLSACAPAADSDTTSTPTPGGDRYVFAYDGGITVLDATTLEQVANFPLAGFNRLNHFGDGEHALVSTAGGFQVLATGAGGGDATLTDLKFAAEKPGHVVAHAGTTVLFDDATGTMQLMPTTSLGASATDTVTTLPQVDTRASEEAHHGVALQLADGSLARTLGNSDKRVGVIVEDANGTDVARAENCPSVHGEGTMKNDTLIFGCENGVLLYINGSFTKLDSPDAAYGRVGNAYVTDTSSVAVTDYKDDPDAEGYTLHRIGFADTVTSSFTVVDLPEGVEYTWRGIRRDEQDNAWILGTDGKLHKVDVANMRVTDSIDVMGAWSGPAQ